MKKIISGLFTILLLGVIVMPANAQSDMKGFFDQQFTYASRVLQLAEAMPADKYSWAPMEGVSSVGEVYLHIAQANYGMLGAIGVSTPGGLNLDEIDTTDKASVVAALSGSIDFTKTAVAGMSSSDLSATYEMYGRTLTGNQVLMFLLGHMSEHVGQSIAYARTNEVVPPWSE